MAIELGRGEEDEQGIGEAEKPSRVEKISTALIDIEENNSLADCITATPGAFLWEFYKAWVENGGQDGGKNRNSIRRMRDVWLTGEHEVKSLHPKLTGKIRITKDDATSLISLFLGRWKFVGVREGDWSLTPDGYARFPCQDCKKLTKRLADAMYPEVSEHARIGLLLPVRARELSSGGLQTGWATVARLYRESDAIINFSRHKVTLGETPPDTMKIFWHLFNGFYASEARKDQIFIWIVDIGSRQAEDDDAWAEFFNFEMLKAQFRAFATFDSIGDVDDIEVDDDEARPGERSSIREAFLRSLAIPERTYREKRWKWLCDHTVIMIQNLRQEEFGDLYADEDENVDKIRLKDTGVTAENILPKMLPHEWARHRQLRDLYGASIDSVADATLTAFFLKDGWPQNDASPRQVTVDVRYFAHALTHQHPDGDKPDLSSAAYSKEIDSPGDAYDEAFRIVYWAARHRLKKGKEKAEGEEDWKIALAYLRNQGFRTLRLPEFLAIHQKPYG